MVKEVYSSSDWCAWSESTAGIDPPIRFAVIGDPVEHSASPAMHNAALDKCGIAARYTRLHIHPAELPEAVKRLASNGLSGVNITIPHKAAALPLVDRVDPHAARIGAINTIAVEGNGLLGYNTDGPGLVRAIRAEFGVDLRDLRIMILGAGGGAGRAVAMQCAIENCERLVLVNRTAEKLTELVSAASLIFQSTRLIGPGQRVEVVPWDLEVLRFQLQQIDLVINCTPIGMKRSDPSPIPASILDPSLMVYDTIYTSERTRLMQAADEAGARSANGLWMLLYQGALAFEIWNTREAPIDAMRAALLARRG